MRAKRGKRGERRESSLATHLVASERAIGFVCSTAPPKVRNEKMLATMRSLLRVRVQGRGSGRRGMQRYGGEKEGGDEYKYW